MHPIRTEYGRDALSDTFGECVVAKANEADCGAQTPKSKHREEGGKLHLIIVFRNAGVSGKKGGIVFKELRCSTLNSLICKTFFIASRYYPYLISINFSKIKFVLATSLHI